MKKLLCLLLLALAGLDVFSQHKFAVIGSSTAGGTGAWPYDSAWARRFNYYYKYQLHILDTTYVLAVGGYPVYKGMPTSYVPPPDREYADPAVNVTRALELLSDLTIPSNGVVVVNYPSNKYDIYSIPEIMFCLQTIYDSVVKAGHRCYIVTSQVRSDGVFGTSAMKRKLADIKDSILNRFGEAHTLNFYDGMYNPADTTLLPIYAAPDNIHFNNTGHRVIFERARDKQLFGGTLPVKLERFTGSMHDHAVQLAWTAELTEPEASFLVERSHDGVHYESLKSIEAKQQAGAQSFSFNDLQPLPDLSFYRLEMKDRSGSVFSKVIRIVNPLPGITLKKLYPVPAQRTLTIELSAEQAYNISCSVIGTTGTTLLKTGRVVRKGEGKFTIPVDYLPAGHYFLLLQYGNGKTILKAFTK